MRRSWLLPFVSLTALTGLMLACHGRALLKGEQYAFRDAGSYYYPLHQRIQAEWNAGRWPFWEPEENGGMPLLGNPTAAVLYPGKLVFAAFNLPRAARFYVIGHTLLAFAAMVALARHLGMSGVGSSLAGLAYAFGGPILFQYCNVIFLVGAAWLPFGLRAVDRWVRYGARLAVAELAVVLAMQVLGGDPETAYLTGIAAIAYAVLHSRFRTRGQATLSGVASPARRRAKFWIFTAATLALWFTATLAMSLWPMVFRPSKGPLEPYSHWSSWVGWGIAGVWCVVGMRLLARAWSARRQGRHVALASQLAGLGVAAMLAGALAGAQLLPTLEFLSRSGRATGEGLLDIYPFSLHPLRLAEFVWPNVFGVVDLTNTGWLATVPCKDAGTQVWTATLYTGVLTLVLAAAGLGDSTRDDRDLPRRGFVVLVLVSLAASLGEYGSPIWLCRALGFSLRSPNPGVPDLRDGDGGVYWLLATVLPGFGTFRYPSKLLTFTIAGLALLAAKGWDRLATGDPRARRRARLVATALLIPTLGLLELSIVARAPWISWLAARKLATALGPLDAAAAVRTTQFGLAQAGVVLVITLALSLRLAARVPRLAGGMTLVVLAFDLAFANARMVATVPQSRVDARPEVVSIIEKAEHTHPSPGPFRIHRVPVWGPTIWRERSAPDRLDAMAAWSIDTLEPKYGITHGYHYTKTFCVTEIDEYRWLFGAFRFPAGSRAARALAVAPETPLIVHSRRAFDLWNTRYFVLPYYAQWDDEFRGIATFLDHTDRIVPPPDAFDGPQGRTRELAWIKEHDFQVRRNRDAFPRAWVVHDARGLPPLRGLTRDRRNLALQDMLFSNDLTWPDPSRIAHDPRRIVWLENDAIVAHSGFLDSGPPTAAETVQIVRHDPCRVELEATLERPGIVVLADVHYPGWTLAIDGQPAPILRANHLMRGAAVKAGRHRLTFSYIPTHFVAGLIISTIGLIALVGHVGATLVARRQFGSASIVAGGVRGTGAG